MREPFSSHDAHREPRSNIARVRKHAKLRSRHGKILRMQWRPVLIVTMIVLNVVFISTVFLEAEGMYTYPTERFVPWIACLGFLGGKEKCMNEAKKLGPSENLHCSYHHSSGGKLLHLSSLVTCANGRQICGVWGVILIFRSSMLFAWIDLFRGSSRSKITRLDAEAKTQAPFSPRPRSRSSDCELSRLPKHQCVASEDDDSHSDHTYVVPEYSFSAPVRPKASYYPG